MPLNEEDKEPVIEPIKEEKKVPTKKPIPMEKHKHNFMDNHRGGGRGPASRGPGGGLPRGGRGGSRGK